MWPDDPLDVYVSNGDLQSLETVRLGVTAAAAEWSVADVDSLLLVVDELVTNGVDHGRGTVAVRCWRTDDGSVSVEVTDHGPGAPAIAHPAADDEHGRGLLLVDELSQSWGVRDEPDGKTVWAVIAPGS